MFQRSTSGRAATRAPASFAAACALLLSWSSQQVIAQERLAPVVVVGTREAEPESRSTADVVVIDSATIRRSTADSVEELLRREAGLQLVRSGGPGHSTGYFIRGASTNSTVVLVDGVRIGSASLGQAELEGLALSQIDRVEVLRGPGSSLYGADGVGGVVQIFTRRGEGPPRATAGGAIGGYRSRQGDVSVSGAAGAFDYAASLGRESGRGVSAIRPGDLYGNYNPDDDGYSRTAGSARLGWMPATGHRIGANVSESRLRARYDSAEYPPPDFSPDASPDFINRLSQRIVSADYRGTVAPWWTTTLQAANYRNDSTSGGDTTSRFVTRRDQATWQQALRVGGEQQIVVAYEYLRERVGGDVYVDERSRRNQALLVGYSGRIASSSLQADLRRDDNSAYGGVTTGRLGYAWNFTPELKVRALVGRTFRAPTFNDLYYPGYGVSTVQPEKGRSAEIGVAWTGTSANASATLWRNDVTDLIAYQPDRTSCPADPAFDFGCAGNVGRARLQGATLAAGARFGGLDLRANVDLLHAVDADTGVRLARRAAHQERLAAGYTVGAYELGASLLVVGSRPDAGVTLGGYGVVDLRAAWRFAPSWKLEAKLLNALDHRVEPLRDYQGLGRQAWIGVRFDSAGI